MMPVSIRSIAWRAARSRRTCGSGRRSIMGASGSNATSSRPLAVSSVSPASRADVPPEQRLPRNRQGHLAHLSGDVEVVAVLQAIARIEGQRDHHVGVCGQLGLLERGLDQPPLPAVQGAIARQHAVSEQAPRAPERLPLREAMLTGDEHLLDVVGMVEQEHAKRGEPDVHDVAVLGAEP